ncbi:MAG: polyphenol oxidase family protein [Acidimicrobiales bacterium]|nr:polyphenol oxidase family protein [Acidimicrobiales bacterium]MDG2218935.1 polyphenol oxidase family protein [Acidimicrobiales bacterium]
MGFTDRGDGDFHVDGPVDSLDRLRQQTMAGEWTWLRQIHGADVVTVTRAGEGRGASADAAVTAVPGVVLAVQTADCVPIVLIGDGVIGIAHAGWRGIVEGVLAATVERMRQLGADNLLATIGACIRPSHYEFGLDDLDAVVAVTSDAVRSVSDAGNPALDMAAATRVALQKVGVERINDLGHNTADERFHSHRTRGDTGRQVSVVRLETNR